MKPALVLVRPPQEALRSELGIVSNIPIPTPYRWRLRRQLEACEIGDSFLTKSSRVYTVAKKLGIKIRVENGGGGKKGRYYRVWKIKDATCV